MDSREKAKKVKAILFDVDGVLTDGSIIYGNSELELKSFNVKDGQIVDALRKEGFLIGTISGRSSDALKRRCLELKVDFVSMGCKNKIESLERFCREFSVNVSQVAYIGDDLPDLPVFSRVGFSACPSDAKTYIQKNVDMVVESPGGKGAFRDLAEFVLQSQGRMERIIREYKGD